MVRSLADRTFQISRRRQRPDEGGDAGRVAEGDFVQQLQREAKLAQRLRRRVGRPALPPRTRELPAES